MRPTLLCLASLTAFLSAGSAVPQEPGPGDPGARPEAPPDGHGRRGADDHAEDTRPDLAPLSRRESLVRLSQFDQAAHWSAKGVVLSSLGTNWHPEAVSMIVESLKAKDDRLRALGLDALRRMDAAALRSVASAELVEVLMKEPLDEKNKLFAARLQEVLRRIFPDVQTESRSEWRSHWRKVQPTYTLPPWEGPDDPQGGRTTTDAAARALDLATAGLEVCFVIDATGSMQPLVDMVVQSAQETSEVLAGFASGLRLATVIYRDLEDMPGGSDVVEPLTKDLNRAFKALGKVVAGGGGDIPEAVDAGLEHALSLEDVGWSEEANKLVVIMGDAPLHDARLPHAIELAQKASRDVGVRAGSVEEQRKQERRGRKIGPRTGPDLEGRPFVISCIAATAGPGGGGGGGRGPDWAGRTAEHFRQIAEAGKGMYDELDLASGGKQGARRLVEMVVLMSFGAKYERDVRRFLDTFFEYRAAGFF